MDLDQKTPPGLLYRYHGSMKVGDVHRFIITFTPENRNETSHSLFVRVKNTETVLLRPNVLTGPYMFYCDIASAPYTHLRSPETVIDFVCRFLLVKIYIIYTSPLPS